MPSGLASVKGKSLSKYIYSPNRVLASPSQELVPYRVFPSVPWPIAGFSHFKIYVHICYSLWSCSLCIYPVNYTLLSRKTVAKLDFLNSFFFNELLVIIIYTAFSLMSSNALHNSFLPNYKHARLLLIALSPYT